jgi:hypothetical protein
MAAIGATSPDRPGPRPCADRDRLIVASIERRVQTGPNDKQYRVTYRVRYRGADGRERSKSFKR